MLTLDSERPYYGLWFALNYAALCLPQFNIKIVTCLQIVRRNVIWYCLNSIKKRADDRQLGFVSNRFRFMSHLGDRTTWQVFRISFLSVPLVKCLHTISDHTTTAPFPKILQQSTQYSTSYTTTTKVVSVVE